MLEFLGEAVFSFMRLFRGKARFRTKDFILVLQECGADALPIVTFVSFLVGFTLAFVGPFSWVLLVRIFTLLTSWV